MKPHPEFPIEIGLFFAQFWAQKLFFSYKNTLIEVVSYETQLILGNS